MIKPFALAAAFATLPLMGLAQTVDSVVSVQVEVNVISDEPDMAGGLTALLNDFMASVKDIDAREGSGDLSKAEADAERLALNASFEAAVEAMSADMGATHTTFESEGDGSHRIMIKKQTTSTDDEDAQVKVIKIQVEEAMDVNVDIEMSDDGDVDFGDDECTSDKSDENDDLSISIGGMVFMQPMDFLYGEFMPVTSGDWAMTPRQAKQVSINFRNQDRIGQSSFWLRRGLGFSSYVMDFGPDRYMGLVEGQNSGVAILDSDSELMKSNFSVGYIELPLSLVYNGSASGSKGLSLAIGGFAGLRVRAETETLRRMDSGWLRQTTLNGFYTNRFAYGVQTEIGYKKFFVASRMNLNPFFQQRADVSTPLIMAATMSVGIHL